MKNIFMDSLLNVSIGQHSDKGLKAVNQDCHNAAIPSDSLLFIKGASMAMADGISSSDVSGDASETAVKTFLDDYYSTSEAWTVKNSVEKVLGSINSWLHAQTLRGPNRLDFDKGYVCTFSTVIIKNRTAHLAHIGDTRIYRLNQQGLEQLTKDHRTWESEEKSYLNRALGMQEICPFDYQSMPAHANDYFIICTDGVYEFITPQDIIESINQHAEDLNVAAKKIIDIALSNSSNDNLSIQILHVDALPTQSDSHIKNQIDALAFPPELKARMDFDGYTLLRELHANSRSHVYLAQDNQTNKQVVLKSPSVSLGDDERYIEHFLLEEWVARRINNEHVLKADLQDRKRNYIYTVFEYIEGQTLAQWVIDNPKPSLEVVRGLIEQIAKGMYAFHKMEMLHQDLRPENIMLDKQGTIKIIDFGAVYISGLDEASTNQPDTFLMGTALYSAPEYFLGEPGTIKSEIFSLGVIAYFLLSGQYPYKTNVAKTKTLSAQKKLWYYTLLDDERAIPAWVDDAIRKAVNPQPDKRYGDVFEFLHDLRHPNKHFINKTKAPLIKRNPVAVWQGISFILTVIIIILLAGNR